jgi:hypothetical protein
VKSGPKHRIAGNKTKSQKAIEMTSGTLKFGNAFFNFAARPASPLLLSVLFFGSVLNSAAPYHAHRTLSAVGTRVGRTLI